jgi:hypothetical protein
MFEISSSAVRAVMVTKPLMSVPELVMNCLAPLITKWPSSSRAVVRVLDASEPASGSVSPKAPSFWPLVSCGIHSCLSSSLPKAYTGHVPRLVWAATVMATLLSTRASSSIAIA